MDTSESNTVQINGANLYFDSEGHITINARAGSREMIDPVNSLVSSGWTVVSSSA
jgi:hypothetical protein